ncbi:MAG: NusG domain II-containing protein [Butyrivibrio sp.]|nr:NusG domain II-containing protein [Butyrivibrio sp.]
MDNSQIKVKKSDIVLIVALLVGFLAMITVLTLTKSGGAYVVVSVDSVEVAAFSLDQDITYEIKGFDGGSNTLIIQDGKAHLEDSSCPDHLCEHMGKIDKVGQSIICLPNRVVVEIRGAGDDKGFDTISS